MLRPSYVHTNDAVLSGQNCIFLNVNIRSPLLQRVSAYSFF